MKSYLWLLFSAIGLSAFAVAGYAQSDTEDLSAKIQAANLSMVKAFTVDLQKGAPALKKVSDKAMIARVKAQLSNVLKDPDSAKFRKMRIGKKDGFRYVCGELNATNSYGGYVGFKPFVSDGANATTVAGWETEHYEMALLVNRVPTGMIDDLKEYNPVYPHFCPED